MFKKVLIFILCLLPWFLSYIIPYDYSYYQSIKLPFFAPPNIFYIIAWTIIYILIACSTYKVFTSYSFSKIPNSYKIILLINYICNQSYPFFFFGLKSAFLGFVSCITTFITSLFLYQETTTIKYDSAKYLDSYIILSLFATILSLTIYIMNSL